MALFSKQNKEAFTNPLNLDGVHQSVEPRPPNPRTGVGYLLGACCD